MAKLLEVAKIYRNRLLGGQIDFLRQGRRKGLVLDVFRIVLVLALIPSVFRSQV